ncbi:MAG TPA: lipoyl(octanoyl) transferase LipB [Afifellaceae bacterium]|nr:lipoyl(octanoyl) transferase LipB [Afifellaceae bacterium]
MNGRPELPPGQLEEQRLPRADGRSVEWLISDEPVAYSDAIEAMEARVAAISAGTAHECVWLLEHPPLYTAGTSARDTDLTDPARFPVYRTGRGGEYTYHGPGQRVAYVMLDLKARQPDVRQYVTALEAWVVAVLARFNVRGERRQDRVGVWVTRPDRPPRIGGQPAEDKIAAIGIRVRRWITLHGISLNIQPDLDHYSGIEPCGIEDYGVTSLADLGIMVSVPEVDAIMREEFQAIFGSGPDG